MYLEHQPQIRAWASLGPKHTGTVVLFASLSVRQQFSTMLENMKSVAALGIDAPILRNKQKAATYLWFKDEKNLKDVYHILHNYGLTTVDRLHWLCTNVPNLGLAKAGFVTQMIVGQVGCLDTHNIKRFGLRPLRSPKDFGRQRALQMVQEYIDTCERLGGPQFLWDDWCTFVHQLYPGSFRSPDDVSLYHVVSIMEGYSDD